MKRKILLVLFVICIDNISMISQENTFKHKNSAQLEIGGRPLDIKKKIGSTDGYFFKGKIYTGRSLGNYLAGYNAATLKPGLYPTDDWYRLTMSMAGAVHMDENNLNKFPQNGKWSGEIEYSGRRITEGFYDKIYNRK